MSLRMLYAWSFFPIQCSFGFLPGKRPRLQFLSHNDSSPLTRFQLSSIFKNVLVQCGNMERFLFCIDVATASLSEEAAMWIEHWSSQSYAGYVHPDLIN